METKYLFNKELHAHTYEGKPLIGTSSVASVISKPLHWWALQMGLKHLGWTPINDKKTKRKVPVEQRLPTAIARFAEIKELEDEAWLALLDTCYYAHDKEKDRTAKAGTDLHAGLERFVKDHMSGVIGEYEDRIKPFTDWTYQNIKRFIYSEAHCYSTEMWTGGISDCMAETNDGKYVIFDFKSSKEAYLSQFWQCAGYAIQVEENGWFDSKGNLLGKLDRPVDYVCVVPFGAETVEPQFNYDMAGNKEAFKAEVLLYKKLNQ